MDSKEQPGTGVPARTHLLFFRYVPTGPYTEGERDRRTRASEMVDRLGGACEIHRFPAAWNGFSMMSIVRGLSGEQVRALAREIDSWGAVQTTVVEVSDVAQGLRR